MHLEQLWTLAPVLLLAAAAGVMADSRCPQGEGWFYHQNKCYYWSAKTRHNWFQAELTCRGFGGGLVSIHDSALNNFLLALTLCTHNSWIGLVNTDTSKISLITGYSWWNGSPRNFTFFSGSSNAYMNCGMMGSAGRWRNTACQNSMAYLCEAPSSEQAPADEQQPAASCPDGWLRHDNNCYYVSQQATNYFNAQMSCQAKEASVASVLSQREQSFLTLRLGCTNRYWIGLEKSRPCFNDSKRSFCWVWMDKSELKFNAWGSSQQNDRREMECAYTLGDWRVANCYAENRYVCKKAARR